MKVITASGLNFSELHSVNYDKGFIDTTDCTRLEPEQIEELERVCEFEVWLGRIHSHTTRNGTGNVFNVLFLAR